MTSAERMTVRRPAFTYPSPTPAHWNGRRPEFSHIVNAGLALWGLWRRLQTDN